MKRHILGYRKRNKANFYIVIGGIRIAVNLSTSNTNAVNPLSVITDVANLLTGNTNAVDSLSVITNAVNPPVRRQMTIGVALFI